MDLKQLNVWYLMEWMEFLKLKQKDITEKTGWQKAKINRLYNDRNSYTNEVVIGIAKALDVKPYELFMPPEQAMVMRILGIDENSNTSEGISIHFTDRMLRDLARTNALRVELDRLMVQRMMERS